MQAQQVARSCQAVAARFSQDREARRQRTALDPSDFDALRDAGFPLLAVPVEYGGAFTHVHEMTRPICDVLGSLAGADPSLALVASMHPAVLGYWLTTPSVPHPHEEAWQAQRREIFEGVGGGHWWGTITSEPGSGGDVLKTKTTATGPTDGLWRIRGEKHFGSGSGATTYMVTTARPEGETLPDLFFLDVRDASWDGSRGMELAAEWDGHGMAATQSHAFRFDDFPANRVACPMAALRGMPMAVAFYECAYVAVIVGVVRVALARARAQMEGRRANLRAYESVEWTRARNEAWLIEQAFEGVLRSIEQAPSSERSPSADALRGKTVIAELAESTLTRLGRVLGGGTFSRRSPFGTWAQDVRALGFLRPPWGLAYDQLATLND